MRPIITKLLSLYHSKNSAYLPLLAGLFYCLGVPPFNSLLHPVFTFFPFLSFIICIPFLYCSSQKSIKQTILFSFLFGITASAGQFYWIALVVPEGLWHLILIGVVLITLYESLYFICLGLLFRLAKKRFPSLYPFICAAVWVLIEYIRSLGEVSFPWNYIGYSLTPILPLAQLASVTGIFGISFLIVLGNGLILSFLTRWYKKETFSAALPVFVIACLGIAVWGGLRMNTKQFHKTATLSVLQGNIDQNHWGNNSLDTSFDILEGLTKKASLEKPDLIIMPESALLCYLIRQRILRERILHLSQTVKIPMLIGALHWDPSAQKGNDDYNVYNTAFFLDTNTQEFKRYFKINLVPFSEALPFQGLFPMLSRVNLGQADFKRGKEETVFSIGSTLKPAPFICYEIIYPSYVRNRVRLGANILVNMTNDGWFGKSSGAYQHATMARMRCIENGISLARSANTGISMFVDQFGRILGKTQLYTRTELTGKISYTVIPTLYTRFGNWPVLLSLVICLSAGIMFLAGRKKKL